jgi:hypothetical protein
VSFMSYYCLLTSKPNPSRRKTAFAALLLHMYSTLTSNPGVS